MPWFLLSRQFPVQGHLALGVDTIANHHTHIYGNLIISIFFLVSFTHYLLLSSNHGDPSIQYSGYS